MKGLKELSIFDAASHRYIELLHLVLVDVAARTHLPEIYEVFGKDLILKFLDTFSGATIRVPPRDIIENSLQDVCIYMRLKDLPGEEQQLRIRELADHFDTSAGNIRKSFVRVEGIVERYKLNGQRRSSPQPVGGDTGTA